MGKKQIALFFGGRSQEHDISILTAISIANAIDSEKYAIIPVYIDKNNQLFSGATLLKKENYYLTEKTKKSIHQVEITINHSNNSPSLRILNNCIFGKKHIDFDIAFPAFHGTFGEDGSVAGLFEFLNIPYVGSRVMPASIAMNKYVAKELLRNADINILPSILLNKNMEEEILDLAQYLKKVTFTEYPLCVKPCNLGSSIGVNIVKNEEELKAAITEIFQLDNQILIEPFVENLVEYNIAITSAFGEVRLSAIEKPLKQGDLLDFKTKYLNGKNRASKLAGPSSEGMASLQREINPKELTAKQRQIIEKFALNAFKLIGQSGAPRIDFLTNSKTKEIWLNEINPFPGSLGYYLWEKSEPKVNFTKLLDNLIQEGFKLNKYHNNFTDPVKTGSNIFE